MLYARLRPSELGENRVEAVQDLWSSRRIAIEGSFDDTRLAPPSCALHFFLRSAILTDLAFALRPSRLSHGERADLGHTTKRTQETFVFNKLDLTARALPWCGGTRLSQSR